ncbi:probable TIM54 (component of the mitochondrial TIM22 translocase) [Fusarium torulosum]|uniref:Mitochondrial import inner membrane translocase subunit TIM54 n=1 Tax=Fusarium torulosum TaxID=33205 RepID=A0AAE8SM26_9HYPO|nr:probable TIM54 (component of the mitochondrial TIM22 translocase) [Fusarium torulosum]
MAESNPPPQQPAAGVGATYKAPSPKPKQNPALKMMGLPNLPRKLPSRNWLIFWAITGSISAAIIYDKREKKRATAKWKHVVAPLATDIIPSASQLPRKLTVYLEAPPGDGLRIAQDHFIEYAKPVLAASGLDWEFVQGRQQGDVRAAVAEKIRRERRKCERPGEEDLQTDEAITEALRKKNNVPEYEGVKGDIVFGLHTWKEYMRGLHEGWLGPLDPPAKPETESKPAAIESASEVPKVEGDQPGEKKDEKKDEEKKDEEKKPERPPQPLPYNTTADYSLASLPAQIPSEFSPANPIPLPHRLGFRHTLIRLNRFFNRRKLADEVGREVAAVCFAAASREWREADGQYEQQLVLKHEENDWVKSVWKTEEPAKTDDDSSTVVPAEPPKERIWPAPIVIDPRLAQRMRRFEITAEDEARAAQIKVSEAEVEGWIKGSLRSLWNYTVESVTAKPMRPNVGNVDSDE